MRQKVCINCKKETDQMRAKLIAGDISKIGPGIIPAVPMKCDRCGSLLTSNREVFLVNSEEKTYI